MKHIFSMLMFAAAMAGVQGSATAAPGSVSIDDVTNLTMQKQTELRRAQLLLAPVHSLAELKAYIATHSDNPLNAFSARAAQRFMTSLTFNQLGLTSFSYADLQDLRPRQAYAILSLFGAQDVVASIDFQAADETERMAIQSLRPVIVMDYQNYRCAPPATCMANSFTICLSTCQVP